MSGKTIEWPIKVEKKWKPLLVTWSFSPNLRLKATEGEKNGHVGACTLCWEGRCWQIAINESEPALLIELEACASPPSKYLPKQRAKTGQRVLWPSQSITARGRRWLSNLPNPNSHFMTALLRIYACPVSQPMKQSRISPSRFPQPQHTDFSSHLIDWSFSSKRWCWGKWFFFPFRLCFAWIAIGCIQYTIRYPTINISRIGRIDRCFFFLFFFFYLGPLLL